MIGVSFTCNNSSLAAGWISRLSNTLFQTAFFLVANLEPLIVLIKTC